MNAMSVVPSDSVSAAASLSSGQLTALFPASTLDPASAVYTHEHWVGVAREFGVDNANKLLAHAESTQKYIRALAGMGVGCATGSRSGSSVSGGGLTASRVKSAAGRAVRGRAAAAPSWRPVSPVPDGFCYSKLLRRDAGESIVGSLGAWPRVSELLDQPAAVFEPLEVLERFRVCPRGAGWHVAAGGLAGESALASLTALAVGSRCPPGSFGALLSDSSLALSALSTELSADSRLGGFRPVAGRVDLVDCMGEPVAGKPSAFLAGSLSVDWRPRLARALPDVEASLLSPLVWATGVVPGEVPASRRWSWERGAVVGVDVQFFYFSSGSSSAATMLELGVAIGTECPKVLCVESGCPKEDYLVSLGEEYGYVVCRDLESAARALGGLLSATAQSSRSRFSAPGEVPPSLVSGADVCVTGLYSHRADDVVALFSDVRSVVCCGAVYLSGVAVERVLAIPASWFVWGSVDWYVLGPRSGEVDVGGPAGSRVKAVPDVVSEVARLVSPAGLGVVPSLQSFKGPTRWSLWLMGSESELRAAQVKWSWPAAELHAGPEGTGPAAMLVDVSGRHRVR